jgi:hypothetical protein
MSKTSHFVHIRVVEKSLKNKKIKVACLGGPKYERSQYIQIRAAYKIEIKIEWRMDGYCS